MSKKVARSRDPENEEYLISMVEIGFHDLIGIGIEGLNDMAESQILNDDDEGIIADISYEVIEVKDNVLTIRVRYMIDEY